MMMFGIFRTRKNEFDGANNLCFRGFQGFGRIVQLYIHSVLVFEKFELTCHLFAAKNIE